MELFEMTRALFDREFNWKALTEREKSKHFFMVNRFMSINFPMQASIMNKRNVSPGTAMDVWRDAMTRLYTKPPGWMYTKTAKRKAPKAEIERWKLKAWARLMCVSPNDVDALLEMFPKEVAREIESIGFSEDDRS